MPQYLPSPDWLKNYSRMDLSGDTAAGLTVAVMLIPQAMAYAMLAGLPPVMGLYASVLPLVVYALLGTSRHLAVGPVAMVSLLVASGVSALAESGGTAYIQYAVLLALLIGVLQLLMGLFRLGFLVNFISHPVISGFTSAAALIIGLSQLKHLLGIPLQRSHYVHRMLLDASSSLEQVHWPTLILGAGAILLLLGLRRLRPAFPGALTVVILGIVLVTVLDLHHHGVSIVGIIPAGLPAFALPALEFAAVKELLPIALAISLVSFMESISIAKSLASRYRYRVNADQELNALGMANIAAAFFSGYPVTGGFSRTAVNAQAGARTPLASLITAIVIALTLLFFTGLLHNLPNAVLAAIIMVAVFGLIDVREFFHLWKIQRVDALMLLVTFVATLALGIEPGILAGVGLSLALLVIRTTRPHYAVLGQLPDSRQYRNIKYFPDAVRMDGVLVLRIDSSFYFGNVNFLQDTVMDNVQAATRCVVIDASSVNSIDSSAAAALDDIRRDLATRDIALLIANIKGPTRERLIRSGFYETLGAEHFFYSVHDAVEFHRNNCALEKILSEANLKPKRKP